MQAETQKIHGGANATAPHLSRRRKAAVIVQLLISDGGKLSLSALPEHLQEILALELGAIRLVDRDTVNAVAAEFADLLDSVGLSSPGGAPAAINALAENLSPALASRLQARFGQAQLGDPWVRLGAMETEKLADILQSECVQIAAVALSKLPVEKAAGLLAALPGDRARKITLAISQTEAVAPAAVLRIGQALVSDHGHTPSNAFETAPTVRVGAILNSSTAATRDALLEGLDGDDAEFAKGVRKAIFTFADIPVRVGGTDVPNCIRAIDGDTLATAIAAALGMDADMQDSAEYILSNISQRMAAQIREDANAKGKVKNSVGEDAMKEITGAIRAQVDAGTLAFLDPAEEEDED